MKRDDISTGFREVDTSEHTKFFLNFVDKANKIPDVQACKIKMQKLLKPEEGKFFLDIGCGTGDDVHILAQQVGSTGKVVGVDNSSIMIDEACKRYGNLNLPLEFVVNDINKLNFEDKTFDAVRVERTLMHVENVENALREMLRVIRSNGHIVVFDFDWDAISINSSNVALTRKIVHLISDSIRNGWIGRKLASLFVSFGLNQIQIIPHPIYLNYEFSKLLFSGILNKVQEKGVLSHQEINTWWQDLEKIDNQNSFLVVMLGFIVVGYKN